MTLVDGDILVRPLELTDEQSLFEAVRESIRKSRCGSVGVMKTTQSKKPASSFDRGPTSRKATSGTASAFLIGMMADDFWVV
jgi:hypothetical protein